MTPIRHLGCIFLCLLLKLSPIWSGDLKKQPSVVIIGAGVAGIGAAAKLIENGIDDVHILEAEDRIGGRIFSVEFGDGVVDLGAEWVHGRNNNVVYEMVKDLDVVEDAGHFFDLYESGGKLFEKSVSDELWKIVSDYMEDDSYNELDTNDTIGHVFTERYNKAIAEKWKSDDAKHKDAKKAFDLFKKCITSYEGAFDWNDATATSKYVQCEGKDTTWKGKGYRTLFDIITKKYPDPNKVLPVMDKVALNKEVRNVRWGDDVKKLTVKCTDGTTYISDYVIFTPSLGVLKDNHRTLFTPQLPREKQEAIKHLGFGSVTKVVLKFPTAWWTTGNGFGFVWSDEDKASVKTDFPKATVVGKCPNGTTNACGDSWLESFIGFFKVPHNAKVMTAWLAGPLAKDVEQARMKDIREGAMYLLNKFVASKDKSIVIPEPDGIIRTKWYDNKHFRGTYPYDSVSSKTLGITNGDLGKPCGRLLFAGEATHSKYYSTVHGALESGRREAERIINAQ